MDGRWTVDGRWVCAPAYRPSSIVHRPPFQMKFKAEIDIMPHKELLDPQGKTVTHSMKNLNISGIDDIRIGKHVSMTLDAKTEEEASAKVDSACKKLLANPIVESYTFQLTEA